MARLNLLNLGRENFCPQEGWGLGLICKLSMTARNLRNSVLTAGWRSATSV